MDLLNYIAQWKNKEVVAFCGPSKYRGILTDALEGGYLVLSKTAVVSPGQETVEYESVVLNMAEVSGLACEEMAGRGAEDF